MATISFHKDKINMSDSEHSTSDSEKEVESEERDMDGRDHLESVIV